MENYEIKEFGDKELNERTKELILQTISLFDEWNVLFNDMLCSKEDNIDMVDRLQMNIIINQLTTYRKKLIEYYNSYKNEGD